MTGLAWVAESGFLEYPISLTNTLNVPRVANGLGVTILSTPKGVMADHSARENNVGGEVLLWPIVFIGPRVGLFHTVSGNETNKRWFVSLDLGIAL